jgi:hypothetical protein
MRVSDGDPAARRLADFAATYRPGLRVPGRIGSSSRPTMPAGPGSADEGVDRLLGDCILAAWRFRCCRCRYADQHLYLTGAAASWCRRCFVGYNRSVAGQRLAWCLSIPGRCRQEHGGDDREWPGRRTARQPGRDLEATRWVPARVGRPVSGYRLSAGTRPRYDRRGCWMTTPRLLSCAPATALGKVLNRTLPA